MMEDKGDMALPAARAATASQPSPSVSGIAGIANAEAFSSDSVERVNFGGAPFREMADIYEAVWDAIMTFEGRVPTMGVVGVLRLVEHRLLTNVHTGEE